MWQEVQIVKIGTVQSAAALPWFLVPLRPKYLPQHDIHVSVHHDIIYENDQQDATV